METQVANTTTLEPTVTRTRKSTKSERPIPDGYMSLDEFGSSSSQQAATISSTVSLARYRHSPIPPEPIAKALM